LIQSENTQRRAANYHNKMNNVEFLFLLPIVHKLHTQNPYPYHPDQVAIGKTIACAKNDDYLKHKRCTPSDD
jgi:hypothetical protein